MNQNLPIQADHLFCSEPNTSLRLSVIVPAKNEADFIVQALDALRMQVDEQGMPINASTYEVLVLANNCSDSTYAICMEYKKQHPDFNLFAACIQLEAPYAHIGTARRLLMDAAYRRLMSVAGAKGIIVSTDADSEVAPDWVHHITSEIDGGADVIGGRILPKNTPAISKRQHLRDVTYRFLKTRLESVIDPRETDPWPRHFQCYGPSLAVTCEIYDKAGRLPVIPYLEDEEFRKALNRIDAKIRHSPKVRIYTSGRLEGRVEFGFSVQLQQWSDMSLRSEQQKVESLATLMFKFEFKNRLRSIWKLASTGGCSMINITRLASWAKVNDSELLKVFDESVYFESLWEKVDQLLLQLDHPALALESIDSAIKTMRMHFNQKSTPRLRKLEGELLQGTGAMAG
ncbi:family 2 glycosyl transferase [Pedobacter yonginense]|uniref:Family 2 glycosyl transferase n=1 Tax=Pedobacter yonginense TaxID=651869 RepID=A0A317EU86_9SPHI|nr:glycosyltransferase [Pedobacter yonginense]PWS29453.1 family 2 glycosyl transferase [Pedobacter yonginense]